MPNKNLPPREKRTRQSQNTKYKDYVCETKNNNKGKNKKNKLPCNGCDLVFEKRDILVLHQATCLAVKVDMSKPRSFFANQKPKTPTKSTSTVEKNENIPPSQPLGEYKYREDQSPISYADIVSSPTVNPTHAIQVDAEQPEVALNNSLDEVLQLIDDGEEVPINDSTNSIQQIAVDVTTPIATISLAETTRLSPDLPDFVSAPLIPNKPYNGIDGQTFARNVLKIYEDMLRWKKNLFQVPTGQCGKDFISLISEWMGNYVTGNTFQALAMKVIMIIPNLLLQKPSAASKAKDHFLALEERLKQWGEGKITELWKNCQVIQKKLSARPPKPANDINRIFTKLVFEGKLGAAMKFLDENAENAVLKPTPEVIEKLKSLHPEPSEILPETLLHGARVQVPTACFNEINEQTIKKAASQTKGSGGPSHFDSKQWRRILCSNQFKKEGKELREKLAQFAQKIATKVVDPDTLEAYLAGRLLALDKAPGDPDLQVRPIAVGEVLRRIVGKTIAWTLNEIIQEAAGPLQVSTGLKGGAEAAIHSMKKIFEFESTDAIILVDAANAFNRLNRAAALHNIQFLCPPFATVLINTYRNPARLILLNGGEILSTEGTTQGDTLAMAFYGVCTNPILRSTKMSIPSVYQVWLADDATGAGSLCDLREWWDMIKSEGIKYGYYVKPSKSWIVLKDPAKLSECERIFESSPINITVEGKRHLGAAIGSQNHKNEYIDTLILKWKKNIEALSKIAKSQPHAAYAAYIHAEQHKHTYFLRTISNISENFKSLDDTINNTFIPALFGFELNDNDRDILSLPIREGGLGIRKVSENADKLYLASSQITLPLITQIVEQSDDLPAAEDVVQARTAAVSHLKEIESQKIEDIKQGQDVHTKRALEQLSAPGASSWLGALPLESHGFNLTKGEFQDALALRYNKPVKNLPEKCPCDEPYTVTHALNCHRGGFVNARHDNIKHFECGLLKSVVRDVECEPMLQPVVNRNGYKKSAILTADARLDIRARGFWRDGQNAFFDVRVTNADAESQENQTIKSVLKKHEGEKKLAYNRRVMEVEHGSFTPLVFTTTGVMSHECSIFHKALAEKISQKQGERYEVIVRFLRVKLSFLALKSTLLCLRGSRSHIKTTKTVVNDDFGLALNELGL